MSQSSTYGTAPLPAGIDSRIVNSVNGLSIHVLEAGQGTPDRPKVLLLHGFPELAYSWRKVMPALVDAGYHVIAPDQRGYGCTTGWDADYDGDLASFRLLNLVRDCVALLAALGISHVAAVVGHDFGASVAAYAALIRPDIFRAVVLMSAPFAGPPALSPAPTASDIHSELAALSRPRKHYQWYYSTRPANADMRGCPQGIHDFLRAYFHHKSADWIGNAPFALASWSAAALAEMPAYYIMDRDKTMAETVAEEMPSADQIARCAWLPDDALAVYAQEYARNGFQGGLQWYRCRTEGINADLEVFSGRAIDVPSAFISGAQDWGIHQMPGALETMQSTACTDMRLYRLIEGAGHWVQQEQPVLVSGALTEFLQSLN